MQGLPYLLLRRVFALSLALFPWGVYKRQWLVIYPVSVVNSISKSEWGAGYKFPNWSPSISCLSLTSALKKSLWIMYWYIVVIENNYNIKSWVFCGEGGGVCFCFSPRIWEKLPVICLFFLQGSEAVKTWVKSGAHSNAWNLWFQAKHVTSVGDSRLQWFLLNSSSQFPHVVT